MTLYRVRLQYAIHVQAGSQEDAFVKATKMLRESPEGYIAAIEDASLAKPKGVLERLVTGK